MNRLRLTYDVLVENHLLYAYMSIVYFFNKITILYAWSVLILKRLYK